MHVLCIFYLEYILPVFFFMLLLRFFFSTPFVFCLRFFPCPCNLIPALHDSCPYSALMLYILDVCKHSLITAEC